MGANLTSEMTREEVIRKMAGSGSNCRGGGKGKRGKENEGQKICNTSFSTIVINDINTVQQD